MGASEEAATREGMADQSSENGLLRKENASIRAEYEDVRGLLERDNARLHEIVAEMAAEIASLRGRLAAYDNAHTSSPGGSIQRARKRAAARDGDGLAGNRGARKGHKARRTAADPWTGGRAAPAGAGAALGGSGRPG